MKKLRVTVEGKTYEVLVELIDDAPATSANRLLGTLAYACGDQQAWALEGSIFSAG